MDCSWPSLVADDTIPLRVLQAELISPHAVSLVALELLAVPTSTLQPRSFPRRSVGSVFTADLVPSFPPAQLLFGAPTLSWRHNLSSLISQTRVTQFLPPLTSESAKPYEPPFSDSALAQAASASYLRSYS